MITEYYNNKIKEISDEKDILSGRLKLLAFIRLLFFLGGFALLFIFSKSDLWTSVIVFLVTFSAFLFFVLKYLKLEKLISESENLLKIYNNELETDSNLPNIFGNGIEFSDPFHPYSGDLDIFGKYSLFNRINRTITYEGQEILANWLGFPEKLPETILKRQAAIKELSGKSKFRDKFLSVFFNANSLSDENKGIQAWINNFPQILSNQKFLKYGLIVFSFILFLSLCISFVFEEILSGLFFLFILSFIINFRFKRKVDILHSHASRQSELFVKYADLMDLIEKEEFDTEILKEIRISITGEEKFRAELLKIAQLIKNLDYRLNIFIGPVLNIFLFWDIQQCIRLEKWIERNHDKFHFWLDKIGTIDALLSLSIVRFNNPDWIFPALSSESEVYLEAHELAHPLINNCIANDYSLSGNSRFDIVTGSNMAGKSTFLRTTGINLILGMSGSPVKAKSFDFTPLDVFTYMRISDSIELELSTFHAELERIKNILIYVANNKKCFLLLDELLRGTNTIDRQTGSIALLKQLVRNGASGIVATHDLNLPEMENIMPDNIKNYNFSIQSKDEDLFFDYKLNHGVCRTFNAALLMKKIGIEVGEGEI